MYQRRQRQNDFFTRSLLSVPHHLEHLSIYMHTTADCGSIKTFTKPWNFEGIDIEIKEDNGRLSLDSLQQNFESLAGHNSRADAADLLERFDPSHCDTLSNSETFDDEIIPSSNPDSPLPDSMESLALLGIEQEVTDYVVDSLDPMEDMHVNRVNVHDDEDNILEETESVDYSEEYLGRCVTIKDLCNKLKPVKVTDPFSGPSVEKEKLLLRSQLDFESREKETSGDAGLDAQDAEIKKLPLREENEEEDLLLDEPEERLINIQGDVKLPSTEVKLIKEELSTEQSECVEVLGLLEEIVKKVSENGIESGEFEGVEETSKNKNELQLLTDETVFDCDADPNELLESPKSDVIESVTENLSLPPLCSKKDCMEMSPIEKMYIMSSDFRRKFESETREVEKFFDDVLTMILPVPESKQLDNASSVASAVEILNVTKTDMDCGLEVSLPWDPLSAATNIISDAKMALKASKFGCPVSKHDSGKKEDNPDLKKMQLKGICDTFESDMINPNWRKPASDPEVLQRNETIFNLETKANVIKSLERHEISTVRKTNVLEEIEKLERKSAADYNKSSKDRENILMHLKTPVSVTCKPAHLSRPNSRSAGSPLDDFVLLRTGTIPANDRCARPPIAMVPPKSIVKAAKVQPSVFKTEEKPKGEIEPGNKVKKAVVSPKPEPNREIVSVDLSTDYKDVLQKLEKDSRPLLAFLKEHQSLGQDYHFFTLTPDVTRFLLRQQEKSVNDQSVEALVNTDLMKGSVCLHALVLAADAIKHYSIPAAIGILRSIHDKYLNVIKGMLEPVRKQLAKEQCKLEDSHIVHPKVRRMTHMIQNLIDCDAGYKVIILIKRYFHAAYLLLEDSLKAAKHVRLQKYPMDISDEAFIENSFHGSNIVFAEVSEELQFCPWTYFDFVFEYEYREDSQWYKLCYKENPKLKGFYSFKVETNASSSQDLPDIKEQHKEVSMVTKALQSFSQHILIASTKITANKRLLSELENRHNVVLLERDYFAFYNAMHNSPFHLQPDLLVDERTCIILRALPDLQTNKKCKGFTEALISAQLKCSTCFVIMVQLEPTSDSSFTHSAIQHLSSALVNNSFIKGKVSDSRCHVVYAFNVEEIANQIVTICNFARDNSTVWKKEEWSKREWLTEEMSLHEKFLLSFPFFNSFSAQIALTAGSLKQLLRLNFEELKTFLRWIPENVIKAFHHSVNLHPFEDVEDDTEPNNLYLSKFNNCVSPSSSVGSATFVSDGTLHDVKISPRELKEQNVAPVLLEEKNGYSQPSLHPSLSIDMKSFSCRPRQELPEENKCDKLSKLKSTVNHDLFHQTGPTLSKDCRYPSSTSNRADHGLPSKASISRPFGYQYEAEESHQQRNYLPASQYNITEPVSKSSILSGNVGVSKRDSQDRFSRADSQPVWLPQMSNHNKRNNQPEHYSTYASSFEFNRMYAGSSTNNWFPSDQYSIESSSTDLLNHGNSHFPHQDYPQIYQSASNAGRSKLQPVLCKQNRENCNTPFSLGHSFGGVPETTKPRQAVRALQFDEIQNTRSADQKKPKWEITKTNAKKRRAGQGPWKTPTKAALRSNENIIYTPIPPSFAREHDDGDVTCLQSQRNLAGTPGTVRLTPQKKRRLTFEKVPGTCNGQTRLAFL